MAQKIITTENGEVITKTSKQVKTERRIRKFQKFVSVAALSAVCLTMSSLMVFAENSENKAPTSVGGSATMNGLISIIMWIVRIAVIAIGGIPGIIKIVQGQQEENPRDRNNGIVSVVIAGVAFAATFGIEALIKQ